MYAFLHFTFASGIGRTPGWLMRVLSRTLQSFSSFLLLLPRPCTYEIERQHRLEERERTGRVSDRDS